jgi:hypothetical protein
MVIQITLDPASVIVLLALAAVAPVVLVVLLAGGGSSHRHEVERRAHRAELEIDEIGRRTQQAILAEALRRARDDRTYG